VTDQGLDARIAELRDAARRLRELPDDAPAGAAGALVERCAELAGEIAAELERRYRDARAQPLPGQETLL
jgi:hypothetical protein